MPTQAPFAHWGDDRRPWEEDRHHPLLGRHLPSVLVPDHPEVAVLPSYVKDRVLPSAFKAYTRTLDGTVLCDSAATFEESRWRVLRAAETHG